jgi:hypothetical protein
MMSIKYFNLFVGLVLFSSGSMVSANPDEGNDNANRSLVYEIKATNPRINRRVTGPVVAWVDGVPAEPVDSFVWDGNGSIRIKGKARLEVDTISNRGEIWAEWQDENGHWTYHQSLFAPPSHPVGLRIGSSGSETELINGDPVINNVYLHGDTGAAGPVLPTVFNLLATWGPAEITRNGQPFDNPFDGPVPLWAGHTMTTVGVRDENGVVHNTDGSIFSIFTASKGAVDNDDLEFHLVFHDIPGPLTTNLPPPLSFFYHLTFEKVKIEIKQ